jgi:hypothetical protein
MTPQQITWLTEATESGATLLKSKGITTPVLILIKK